MGEDATPGQVLALVSALRHVEEEMTEYISSMSPLAVVLVLVAFLVFGALLFAGGLWLVDNEWMTRQRIRCRLFGHRWQGSFIPCSIPVPGLFGEVVELPNLMKSKVFLGQECSRCNTWRKK
jgi:hypothetical protein